MHIHYIEDDELDASVLKRAAKTNDTLDVTVSKSLEDLSETLAARPADCILLDVLRPESVSIEDDIARVRQYTDAPIVFITGGNAGELRLHATRVGADAVIDKEDISPAVLKQIFYNISARHQATPQPVETAAAKGTETPEPGKAPAVSLNYLTDGLSVLHEIMKDNGHNRTADFVQELLETSEAIRAYLTSDLSGTAEIALHTILRRMQSRARDIARNKKIRFSMECDNTWYAQAGDETLARLGFQHFVEGALRACPADSQLLFFAACHGEGVKLMLYFDRQILPDASIFFSDATPAGSIGQESHSSLRLGAAILGLKPENVQITTSGTDQMVTVIL
ncbi:response regulator [Parvularcula sp. IMCC14364]|uniref:response regulator n=1 Tax=Parvularcula sp. IMCC14364 TaxID=3067902 RepID=UPI0027423043|nr:response regulator [Parvularcula sp. IMCC14364]